MPHVFLSYSHEDGDLADKLVELVSTKIKVWRDINRIVGGAAFQQDIEEAIGLARCFFCVLSSNSQKSDWVKKETQEALDKKIPIIPLLKGIRAEKLDEWWQTRLGHLHMLSAAPLTLSRKESILRALNAQVNRTCRVVALYNQKGGVGKTTLASQIAARISLNHNKRVLLIDLDPQQNLTELCINSAQLDDCLKHLKTVCGLFEPQKAGSLVDEASAFAIWVNGPSEPALDKIIWSSNQAGCRVDIIPGDNRSIKYARLGDNATLIENFSLAIEAARALYDVIIIDCNPSVSFFTRAMMENIDHLLIPLRPDGFARRGVAFTQRLIEDFYKLDRRPEVSAVFNGVTPEGARTSYESNIMRILAQGPSQRELEFQGVSWLQGGYLSNIVRESDKLQSFSTTASAGNNLAQSLVGRIGLNNNAHPDLEAVTNEYAGKLFG